MLSIILATIISISQTSIDTIILKGTENIYYRVFTSDSNLYFQHNANKSWSAPQKIDEKVSEYAMTVTDGDYIHLVWIKQGRVYYKMNMYPINKDSLRKDGTPRWECNINISSTSFPTEPASNLAINIKGEYICVTWQAPNDYDSKVTEKWRRVRWLYKTPFDWQDPQNISLNDIPTTGIPHSINNRDPIQMKRIVFLEAGVYYGSNILCCDSDHNGLNEIIFGTALPTRWEILEYRPMNHYELVFADTGAYPGPPGITTGNFRPYDVGDIDRDSLTDLVGPNNDETIDTTYNLVTTQESPNFSYYPENLSWWYRHYYNAAISQPFYFAPDLDSDNRNEIMFVTYPPLGVVIFENVGNNQNEIAWNTTQGIIAWSFAFGDLDLDGYKEFITADGSTLGRVYIYENISNNQYGPVFVDTVRKPNGSDVFSGNDLDGDGYPEFFIAFYSYPSAMNYLYMWEATSNNTYQRTFIDQVSGGDWSSKRSKCGDIDGDGIEELVWSIGGSVMAYKATGNNQFQKIWDWINNHGGQRPQGQVNIYDMNGNGYKEIVISGNGKTSIFEVEAIRLLRPNGGEVFQDSTQELIRWQKFYPPRCDSLSLFYSTDNGRTYQSIVHSLSSIDTSYLWTVPNVNSDSCKIKIIAYGPGWQYDETDGVFTTSSTGVEENPPLSALRYSLKVERGINPATTIFSIPTFQRVNLKLYDINGRLIKSLVNQTKEPGIYKIDLNAKTLSSGVYLLCLDTEEKRIIERIVIIK